MTLQVQSDIKFLTSINELHEQGLDTIEIANVLRTSVHIVSTLLQYYNFLLDHLLAIDNREHADTPHRFTNSRIF